MVDFKEPFDSLLVILTFVVQFAHQHRIVLDVGGVPSEVLRIDLLDQLLNFERWDAVVPVWVIVAPLTISLQ